MPRQRILLFEGTDLTALRWQAGRVVSDGRFAPTPAGFESLTRLLEANANDLYQILADIPEEAFQIDTVPFVRGGDRTALINRRLSQYYYGSPLVTAVSLGRDTEGRRDERIQFAALTRPEALTPWLEVIQATRIPLVGIYSVPLVLGRQRWSFGEGRDRFLLCTLSTSGLRQTYFVGGKMHFSRMAALTATSDEAIAQECAKETNRTVQYLVGQRQLPRGKRITVFVLCHQSHTTAMRAQCKDINDVDFEFVDLNGCAAKMGCKTAMTDSRADALLCHLLLAKPPAEQFAPPPLRQTYRHWQVRAALRIASFAILVGCLALTSRFMMQADALDAQAGSLAAQTQADSRRYQELLAGLPPVSVSNDVLRAVITRVDELAARTADVEPMLRHLGTVLERAPGIELVRLAWSVGPKPVAQTGANFSRGKAAVASPTTTAPTDAWVSLEFEARLPAALIGDQRSQLAAIDELARRLRQNNVEAEVLTTPVNIESGKALHSTDYASSGEDPRDDEADERLAFTMRLMRPVMVKGQS